MTSLRFLPEQIEHWPIARLKPYERNPRMHSDAQVTKVAASIASYGWTVPLLVTEDGEVIADHGRFWRLSTWVSPRSRSFVCRT